MSQHQYTSASKITKSTQKVSAPPMDIPDDEILDVVPLSVIPCEAIDLNQPIDASASACPNQGNISSIPSGSTPATNSKEDIHHTDRVEQHSEKDVDSSSSEKDMAAEGLCSLGQTVSEKGKYVASKTVNASHSEKHDDANDKRKVREDSKSEEDVEEDVLDISPVKKATSRKSPVKVPVVPLDNISFHLDDGAAKWKFMIQRRATMERELVKDVVDDKEVMDLIKVVGLLKTMSGFSQCYEGLVKEFIVNIPEDITDKNSKEFCKVFVRGRKIKGAGELEATDNEVCREITARQVKGAANWVSTNHISTIANTLGRFIFVVGTKVNFDYGRFMFEQIIKHASTNAVKLPIAFLSMICGIILNQHPDIICSNDLPSRRKLALSGHYKLFKGSHVEDIVMTSAMKKPASKVGTIAELKETCKELGEEIMVATTRKQSLEALIASLEQAEEYPSSILRYSKPAVESTNIFAIGTGYSSFGVAAFKSPNSM
ncbi:uncharacterized protein LOC127131237 [Lathyrus oleraceus]|uniref:uncharacterized protein LOC127131236 n=1 Tax=Pisum sativum TaxID=3888 RepID=UPI0021D03E9D|nr:uncharacterized protein LOC127131236 [Pisum sativum]XP_050916125.1 uncharacterized protein LOC127131237 [Pisum sativum]